MPSTYALSPAACLFHADARDALKALPADSLDSCVTDPPYALVSIVKRFGSPNAAPAKGNEAYMRASQGFMGKQWDTGECAMDPAFWAEVYRVLKPGAFLAAFGATRGYHRMACAIEDAGFEIRDSLMWVYGQGFPKSQNVALAIDKAAGAVGHLSKSFNMKGGGDRSDEFTENGRDFSLRHEPVTDDARTWSGFGTALKPAFEPIVLARKPLSEDTVAANVLRWRTGAINVDGCRVATEQGDSNARVYTAKRTAPGAVQNATGERHLEGVTFEGASKEGRWPANGVTDGSDEVVGCFPNTAPAKAGKRNAPKTGGTFGDYAGDEAERLGHSDAGGSASRFFKSCPPDDAPSRFHYSAKASKADRNGSKHPTVKPIALMQWLARLITPPGGTVLDPFAGSGTTGVAAAREGFNCVLVEREAEYVRDIVARYAI